MPRKIITALLLAVPLPATAFASSGPNTPTSDTVQIAKGQAFGRSLAISAYDSKFGLCVDERDPLEGDTSCGSRALPRHGRAIEVDNWRVSPSNHDDQYSAVTGAIRSDVATVQIYFHRRAMRRKAKGIFGKVSAEDATMLHQSGPFGRFLALARGCVAPRQFRAVALGSDGQILGTDRGFSLPYGPCKPGRVRTDSQ